MPLLSVITTCKGRLEHLKASLPSLMALPDCEVVVVDYDCPDHARDWVGEAYPAARVVAVNERPLFNLAKARNLGLAAATAPWVMFVDADTIVAAPFVEQARVLLQPGVYLRGRNTAEAFIGTLVAARADLAAIGGYDEVFEGWGFEDIDMIERLGMSGRRPVDLPVDHLTAIPHGLDQRTRFHAIGDIQTNKLINAFYCRVKADLRQHGKWLDEPQRQALYDQVRTAALSPDGLNALEIGFDEQHVGGKVFARSLRYRLREG